jgi:hypothetical protein
MSIQILESWLGDADAKDLLDTLYLPFVIKITLDKILFHCIHRGGCRQFECEFLVFSELLKFLDSLFRSHHDYISLEYSQKLSKSVLFKAFGKFHSFGFMI